MSETPKSEWVGDLPSGPPMREGLARLVDADGGRDDVENDLFEWANDPQFVHGERTRRRFKGQFRRRLRHLQGRARSRRDDHA